MCGIVGFITAEAVTGAAERRRWFTGALRAGVVRGEDGTGAFLVPHKASIGEAADWCKIGAMPEELLQSEIGKSKLGPSADFSAMRAVIGHNRSATIGKVSTANAHPFQEGPITLVHNGTLTSTHNLPTPKASAKGADVDSHVITHNLANHSVAEVVRELDGAYVLVWHDARDQSINIIRNLQRPLHMMQLKFQNTIMLASEAEMLYWLVKRSTFTGGDIYYPTQGQHLKFLPDQGIKPVVTKLATYKWTYSGTPYSARGAAYGREWDNNDAWDENGEFLPYDYEESGRRRAAAGPIHTEGPNTGKADRPALEIPKVARSALNRKIPKVLTQTLEHMGLMHLDKLRMTVIAVTPVYGTKHAIVIGRLLDLPRTPTARIYGLTYEAIKGAVGKETWTVAPVGVLAMDRTRAVLCRLLSRTASVKVTDPLPRSEASSPTLSPPSSTDVSAGVQPGDVEWDLLTSSEKERILSAQLYKDAAGRSVTITTWRHIVGKGCCYCAEVPNAAEAEWCGWDTVTGEVICAKCMDDLHASSLVPDGDDDDDNDEEVTCLGV